MPTPRRYKSNAERQRAYRRRLARSPTIGDPALPPKAGKARWKAILDLAESLLVTLQDEMEEYRDSRSEAWQEGDKGQEFEERIESVQEAVSAVQSVD